MSKATHNYFKLKGLKHIVMSPYQPQANGWIERLKGSLIQTVAISARVSSVE